jgi:murein tripeptide amidase MpaA
MPALDGQRLRPDHIDSVHIRQPMRITGNFDGGNIRVVALEGDRAELEIVPDTAAGFYQWFNFRVSGARGRRLVLRLTNCAGSAYPDGWNGYRARVSDEGEAWRCAETGYADGELTIRVVPASDTLQVAYFAPYSWERHMGLLDRFGALPGFVRRRLGETLERRPLDALTFGNGATQVWLIARQHPGETMAEWWMEGALEKLATPGDAAAAALSERATIHVVPNMNPDGSFLGRLRTNSAGINLNREWQAPSLESSPEVLHVLDAMADSGVDFAIDVHGHETETAAFTVGCEGLASWSPAQAALYARFCEQLASRNRSFNRNAGGVSGGPPRLTPPMAAAQLAERFGAVAMALEMPFKDSDADPDPEHGWSPARSARLAADCLEALATLVGDIPRAVRRGPRRRRPSVAAAGAHGQDE